MNVSDSSSHTGNGRTRGYRADFKFARVLLQPVSLLMSKSRVKFCNHSADSSEPPFTVIVMNFIISKWIQETFHKDGNPRLGNSVVSSTWNCTSPDVFDQVFSARSPQHKVEQIIIQQGRDKLGPKKLSGKCHCISLLFTFIAFLSCLLFPFSQFLSLHRCKTRKLNFLSYTDSPENFPVCYRKDKIACDWQYSELYFGGCQKRLEPIIKKLQKIWPEQIETI